MNRSTKIFVFSRKTAAKRTFHGHPSTLLRLRPSDAQTDGCARLKTPNGFLELPPSYPTRTRGYSPSFPMSSPACRPGLPAPRRQATLLLQPAAPLSVWRRPIHRTGSGRSTFEVCSPGARRRQTRVISSCHGDTIERRRLLLIPAITITIGSFQYSLENGAAKAEFTDMPALRGKDYGKTKMSYPDYTETESGLQYKDLRVGDGPSPKKGETVVVDWDGYTIGYYGRIFEARNKTKGGSFEGGDKEFFKFKIGSGQY
ncbi:hypothetical protein QYE76_038222 [Lolium multiflorum]|uniref:Uncharacterized protein n=1 Tax=Lolium multiflorum TaxID=4521 RepID=A0AAD8WR22_LOLMU|nr:hypothetical protein QYE76_038222 [Lolium multiflorum]